jgi:putative Ca2+/H+ antiporter (TMEM165/GDT1 family)
MDLKLLTTVFATVLLAELGDKTQLSTMLYASGAQNSKWAVFLGAAIALVTSSALAVFVGSLIGSHVNARLVGRVAGAGFVAVGVWTLWRA